MNEDTVWLEQLWKTVLKADLESFKKLLGNRKADEVKSEGEMLVHFASKQRKVEILEWILRSGVSPDVKDDLGWTPLLLACFDENMEAIQVLLKAGANPNVVTAKGYTALHFAAYRGHEVIAEMVRK